MPEEEVRQHVKGISGGDTYGVVAEVHGKIIGVVTYQKGLLYPQYQPDGREEVEHGYVAEAVVHNEHVGKGIGTILCTEAIAQLTEQYGVNEVYAKRHADNVPSARMMGKSGMVEIDEYDDPKIRPTGTRRTTVTRYTATNNSQVP